MELNFSEEQTMLREMVNRLCQEMAPLTTLRELEGTEPGFSTTFWQQLGELGLTGLLIPENFGGMQLGALESVVVAEEFGRCLAVSPFHSSSILAASLIGLSASSKQKDELLPKLAGGDMVIAVASDEYGGDSSRDSIHTSATLQDGRYILNGSKYYVAFGASADTLVVLAKLDDGASSIVGLCIDKSLLNEEQLHYLPNHAKEPLYKIVFDKFEVPAECVLNDGACVWQSWERAMSDSLIHLAAYAVGGAQQVQSITVEYAKYRHAFGRPIGGFQAIAHYLADMEVLIEGARTLVYQAAWTRDKQRPFEQLAAMAKYQACEVFRKAAALAIQVHGGLGYTIEADPQLYFRKAKHLQQMYWDSNFLEQKIGNGVFDE